MKNITEHRSNKSKYWHKFAELFISDILKSGQNVHNELQGIKRKILGIIKERQGSLNSEQLLLTSVIENRSYGQISGYKDRLECFDFYYLYSILHQKDMEFTDDLAIREDNVSSYNNRKTKGAYYTPYPIAHYIVHQCFQNQFKKRNRIDLKGLSILEPCVGTGIFVIAMLDFLYSLSRTCANVSSIDIANIFESSLINIDIDEEALEFIKAYLPAHACEYYGLRINSSEFESRTIKADILLEEHIARSYENAFDIIFFNPPYELLKPNSSEFRENCQNLSKIKYENHRSKTENIKERIIASGNYKYSTQGMLNLYKLFIELTCDTLSNGNAEIGFIVPLTILGDYQCKDLRKHLLRDLSVNSISTIPEKNDFFYGITQALSIINISKGTNNPYIVIRDEIRSSEELFGQAGIKVDHSFVDSMTSNDVIVPLVEEDVGILKKLHKYQKLRDLDGQIGNLRGEIDLTKFKDFITDDRTKFALIRGRDIEYLNDVVKLINANKISYLRQSPELEALLKRSAKLDHLKSSRIVCQQISNLKSSRRLKFTLVPPNIYLGNSCNYLIIKAREDLKNTYGIDEYSLVCLLNSSVYDWRFKLTSTNNHISNNELGDLPIPLDCAKYWVYQNLREIFKKHTNNYISIEVVERHIDANVFKIFDFDESEIMHVLQRQNKPAEYIREVIQIFNNLGEKFIFNHQIGSLSELDMDMVRSVPPGGNWKDIPASVPSKRLERIRYTGGRTTLYGRLRRDRPSYTISTYFNRPGNGTYIHPDFYTVKNGGFPQDRLISFREAARLQSFKDSFIFYGSKSSMLKQIGNAVPPLLAYNLANSIMRYYRLANPRLIDLFCGAGGLSYGFQEAGFDVIIGLDNIEDAIKTYDSNHRQTHAIIGDITSTDIQQLLQKRIDHICIDIIIGGPPCQGFSHAGKRIVDDPRNYLFKAFVEIVNKNQPLLFVMENVEGILTLNEGKTFTSIVECFKDLGYGVVAKMLNSAEYGVPQLRKRVFIIGSRQEINERIFPVKLFDIDMGNNRKQEDLFFENLPKAVTVEEAISDLSFIDVGYGSDYTVDPFPLGLSEYQAFMKGLINFHEFYEMRKRRLQTALS